MLKLILSIVQLHSIHTAVFGGQCTVLDPGVSLATEDIPFPMASPGLFRDFDPASWCQVSLDDPFYPGVSAAAVECLRSQVISKGISIMLSDESLLGLRIAFQLRSRNRKKTKTFPCCTMTGTKTGLFVLSREHPE